MIKVLKIRRFKENDFNEVVKLVAKFRVALARLKNRNKKENLALAREELNGYKQKNIRFMSLNVIQK